MCLRFNTRYNSVCWCVTDGHVFFAAKAVSASDRAAKAEKALLTDASVSVEELLLHLGITSSGTWGTWTQCWSSPALIICTFMTDCLLVV